MRISVVLLLLLLVATLAGCLAGDEPDGSAPAFDVGPWGPATRPQIPGDPLPHGAGHDHSDPSEHKFLWNYDFAHRDPLAQDTRRTAGLHALSLADGYLFGAVYGNHTASANGGLVIWDLADPTNPQQVGHFAVPGHGGGDRSLGVTMDGAFAVLGAEPSTCFGYPSPLPVNAFLIDTRDKSMPFVADVLTIAGTSLGSHQAGYPVWGTHSVWVHNFDGEDYAFIWGKVFHVDRSAPNGASLVDTGVLVPTGHDLYVRDTPWGDVWGLAANGGADFRLYDLTDILEPRVIAVFEDADRLVHTADVAFLEDGHIVLIVTTETSGDHLSPMWVFNATHLKDHPADALPSILEPVHVWTNPYNRTAVNMHFSLHNPRFHDDGILTLSSYHAGSWQLDFRHPEFRSHPAEIAYAVFADDGAPRPNDPVQAFTGAEVCYGVDTPKYMDVEVGPGGIVYAADVMMGLYVFTPTAEHPVFGADA